MKPDEQRRQWCRKCGEVTTHNVYASKTAQGTSKVAGVTALCRTTNQPCGA